MNFANFANFAKFGAKSFAFREILKTQKISNTMPYLFALFLPYYIYYIKYCRFI